MSDITLKRVLPLSKFLLEKTVSKGEVVVDATAGNGNDTLFLAELVGEEGLVYAFDIQAQALAATRQRLGVLNGHTSLILDSHANVDQYVTDEIAGAMFNLGYLPYSEDLTIITKASTTITAIQKIISLLKVSGIISIAVYEGHEGGKEEKDALLTFVKTLHPQDVHVAKYTILNQHNHPPFLLAIEKLRTFDAQRWEKTIEKVATE